ncbi:MAG: hypothetical protein EA385_12030 [Salinarimonadaceae bacterium]|nr:MAG: hypothetical protein EA385_12030 [Salinarimonadaceae bacterium]
MLAQETSHNPRDDAARSFNLFRRKSEPDLFCAVPEDRAVPGFIDGDAWEFGGRIDADTRRRPGFDAETASRLARVNGFYFFQSWTNCPPRAA